MKKLISLICTAAIVLSLSACSNEDATENGTTTEAPTSEAAGTTTTAAPNTETDTGDDTVYVIENGITDKMIELSRLNAGNQVRLANVLKKAENGEAITIAYIGGSITQGSSAGDNLCYARLVTDWFEATYPNATVNYVRAGIGATGSYIGVHRVDKDVLANNPDLVFVEFCVNDTTENTTRNVNAYDSLLQKIWNYESKPALVTIAMTMEDGTSFQDNVLPIVQKYDVPMISYKNAILDVINKGYIKWDDISDDNIHPNVTGHAVLAEIITKYLASVDTAVTGDESNFSEPYTDNVYAEATLLTPSNTEPTENNGFTLKNENFGNFIGYWSTTTKSDASLKFEVEAKNIGIFYGEIVGRGGSFAVYVDGELITTIDANFPNGWGNYVEAMELASFDTKGKHTVEIKVTASEPATVVNISALAIS